MLQTVCLLLTFWCCLTQAAAVRQIDTDALGNGLIETRTYDLQGRPTSWATGSVDSRTYGYDLAGSTLKSAGSLRLLW